MLKIWVILLALFILGGCSPARQKGLIRGQEGNISEEQGPLIKNFGIVKAGVVAKHTFVVKNESAKVLLIKGVTTSCGCTASNIGNKILQPGESTSLEVQFDSKGYSGPVQQFIYVDTDSLENPVIRYMIKADVK